MYPFKQALFIHTAPLVVAASLPFLQGSALRPQIPLLKLYGLVVFETGRAFVCMITTVLAALFMGLARVALFGKCAQTIFPHHTPIPGLSLSLDNGKASGAPTWTPATRLQTKRKNVLCKYELFNAHGTLPLNCM